MTAIKIDTDAITNKVKPSLKKTSNSLDEVINIISGINIPYDFTYYEQLKSLPEDLRSIKSVIENINTWTTNVVKKFENADKKNRSILSSLNQKIDISMKSKNIGSKIVTSEKVNVSGNDNIVDKKQSESFIEEVLSFGQELVNSVNLAIESVGTVISDGCETLYKKVIEPGWDLIKKTGASIANAFIGLLKGLGQFLESILDLVIILGTGIASIFTGIGDGIEYLARLAVGEEEGFSSHTAEMWENTMTFVAEDHVGNAFQNFYKNNIIGQWLDENAFEPFKSDGTVTNILSGLGYVGGVVLTSVATFGLGGAAIGASSAAVTAGIATASATGKYTAEYWANARDASWEGMKRMYEKGEISEEQFNSFQMIRNIDENDWKEIEEDYKNGKISKEEFTTIKQIREMPNDWATLENGIKGIVYGGANGLWEGIQWYVGGKLANWTIKGHKFATSAVRVGADSVFNTFDTPFRAIVEATMSDKTFSQAWIEQGGWKSVLTNFGVGLIGSAAGEIANFKKGDQVKTSNADIADINGANKYVSNIDEKFLQDLYWYQTTEGKIIKPFTPEYDNAIKAGIELKKYGSTNYMEIKNTLINNYGMTSQDASAFIEGLVYTKKMESIKINSKKDLNLDKYSYLFKGKGDLQNLYYYIGEDGKIIRPSEVNSYTNSIISKKSSIEYENIKNVLMKDYGLTSKEASQIISAYVDAHYKANINPYISYDHVPKIAPGGDNRSVQEKLNIAKKAMYKSDIAKYVTSEQIEKAFNNIYICNTREEFERLYKEMGGRNVKGVKGFCFKGKSYIPDDASTQVIIHELQHAMGSVWINEDEFYRAINEAITDNIANNAGKVVGKSAYMENAKAINDINKALMDRNPFYKNSDLVAYFGTDKLYYKKVINSVVKDDSFYDKLAALMSMATDYSAASDSHSRRIASQEMVSMVNYFKDCCK